MLSEPNQRLVRLNDITFLNEEFPYNATFQVLHLLILSSGDE